MGLETAVKMTGIVKKFPGVIANDHVNLEIKFGEVHALLGENGAGKSTLMKVLSGAHAPDTGRMFIGGKAFLPRGPLDARRAGVAMIYQELNLAPDLSVEDNIMLGQEARRFGWLRRSEERAKVHDALALLGHAELQPRAIVGKLPIGLQQLVEIARALAQSARVVVFDEPTSSLPRRTLSCIQAGRSRWKGFRFTSPASLSH